VGRSDFVLDHLGPVPAADYLLPFLDFGDAPDVYPHRGGEFQGKSARSRFGITEEYSDFHPDLVYEDDESL
jgi:hypothetical protein